MTKRAPVLTIATLLALAFAAGALDKPKTKDPTMKEVDSGSYGVFVNGHRMATETFTISQGASGGIATADFKTEDNVENKSAQSSEMELSPNGDLHRYEWKELSPGKAEVTVFPANDFLTERAIRSPQDKPEEQPFMLPASTSILDDYFFSHRQILIWRYLATSCKHENNEVKCPVSQKIQFGTLNPQQRAGSQVSLEFMGRDKATIRGTEKEFNKFALRSEGGEWFIWVDDQFKMQRILIPGDSTEVIRD